jgi:membrane protein DedA with SNARE-associated domain
VFTDLIEFVSGIAVSLIDRFGYAGIVIGMAIESINVPLPSEVVMPFSGALVAGGRFDYWWVVLAGTAGNVIGSIGNYYLGMRGGRPFIERHGKYLLIHPDDLARADRWFQRYGLAAVFVTRVLPVVRTFISFPAGVARVPLAPFIILTAIGSFIWSAFLTYLGMALGASYEETIRPIFRRFDLLIGALSIAGIGWYVWRHVQLVNVRNRSH